MTKAREKLRRTSARSGTKLAREAHVSPSILQRVLRDDIQVKPYKITKRKLI